MRKRSPARVTNVSSCRAFGNRRALIFFVAGQRVESRTHIRQKAAFALFVRQKSACQTFSFARTGPLRRLCVRRRVAFMAFFLLR